MPRASRFIAASRTSSGVCARRTRLGIEPNGTTPEQFAAQIATEQAQFDVAIEAAKLKEP